jgi:phenylacetic acid degradation operon negative regulatory protein
MPRLKCIDNLLADFARRTPVRAGSLIISVFGDSVSRHGNSVWLGSLINVLAPFGLNARQIRTAVFRLSKEGWLKARQVGRRSYYSFTDFGTRHYEKAARRIYASNRSRWDGTWTLVIPAFLFNQERDQVRRDLLWSGYGAITPGLMAHPAGDRQSLDEILHEHKAADKVVVLQAHAGEAASRAALKRLASECWQLDELALRYEEFQETFHPVMKALKKARNPEPDQCFQVRTLLIHEYRRIVLHETDLPDELLPADWSGRRAQTLTANLYRLVQDRARLYIESELESAEGHLPRADARYFQRFGGL